MYAANTQVWFAFVLYLAATFYFAYLAHRKSSKSGFMEDFFVAGRSIGPWVLGLTWIATAASGGTFIGSPALGHTFGWSVMLWICSYMVVATTGFGLFGKRVAELGRRTGALTFPDLLRDRFESQAIGTVSGVAIIILYIAYLVAQYVAGARVIEAVLGVPYHLGVIGFALTVSIYTAYGGFRAVAWTDAFQAVVMLLGVLVTAFFAIQKLGGLQAVYDGLQAQSPELADNAGTAGVSADSDGDLVLLRVGVGGSGSAVDDYAVSCLPGYEGSQAGMLPDRDLHRAALPVCDRDRHHGPGAGAGVGSGGPRHGGDDSGGRAAGDGGVCAGGSRWRRSCRRSAPSCSLPAVRWCAIFMSATCPKPLSEKRARNLSTAATFGVAGLALLFALDPPDFLQFIVVFAGTGLAATFFFPTLLGIYWPRMNKAGCMAGIIGGFGSFLLQYVTFGTKSFGGFDPFIWSMLVSLVAVVGVSFGTPPGSESLRERYFPTN